MTPFQQETPLCVIISYNDSTGNFAIVLIGNHRFPIRPGLSALCGKSWLPSIISWTTPTRTAPARGGVRADGPYPTQIDNRIGVTNDRCGDRHARGSIQNFVEWTSAHRNLGTADWVTIRRFKRRTDD